MNSPSQYVSRQQATGRRRFVAAVGDSNRSETWSGIPYHLLCWGRELGALDEGLELSTHDGRWRRQRLFWNLWRVMTGERPGGFQFSEAFLERLWRPVAPQIRGGIVFNLFQLYPLSVIDDTSVERWFFLDQTLTQLFEHYGVGDSVGREIARQALTLEKRGYQAAQGIVMHSNWAKRSVVKDYGIPEDKVWVVLPGANIEPALYREWVNDGGPRPHDPRRPLRLVFVGKEWQRKGLDRLLEALPLAAKRGFRGTLRVIGCREESVPPSMRGTPGVEWVGFVDRRWEARRFLELVATSDLGCLLSVAEAGGISQREFHALGLAVLGTDAGGAPEHRVSGASFEVPSRATPLEVADLLCDIEGDVEQRRRVWQNAASARESALWSATIAQLQRIAHGTEKR